VQLVVPIQNKNHDQFTPQSYVSSFDDQTGKWVYSPGEPNGWGAWTAPMGHVPPPPVIKPIANPSTVASHAPVSSLISGVKFGLDVRAVNGVLRGVDTVEFQIDQTAHHSHPIWKLLPAINGAECNLNPLIAGADKYRISCGLGIGFANADSLVPTKVRTVTGWRVNDQALEACVKTSHAHLHGTAAFLDMQMAMTQKLRQQLTAGCRLMLGGEHNVLSWEVDPTTLTLNMVRYVPGVEYHPTKPSPGLAGAAPGLLPSKPSVASAAGVRLIDLEDED
jgi:hypothetical protein